MCLFMYVISINLGLFPNTFFSGLATASFSAGITDMCEEFGVAVEVGQVGMFVFNGQSPGFYEGASS